MHQMGEDRSDGQNQEKETGNLCVRVLCQCQYRMASILLGCNFCAGMEVNNNLYHLAVEQN